MLYKISKFWSRLRSNQPTLVLLPGLVIAQSISCRLSELLLCIVIVALLLLLVKSKNFLGLITGLILGLLSSLSFPRDSLQATSVQTKVVGRMLAQGLRYPKPGLMQFGFVVINTYSDDLSDKLSNNFAGSKFLCKAISLPWKNVSRAQPDDLLIVDAKFNFFNRNLWPWEYDAQSTRRGFGGTCKVKYLARLSASKNGILEGFRSELLNRYHFVAGNDEIASLLLSLSLGVRDVISSSSERMFKDLGISHVLVLSGMQIGLIFFGIAFVSRKLFVIAGCRKPFLILFVSCILAAIVSALLVHLTYYEASASRAWIACVLVSIAKNSERDVNLLRGTLASFLVLSLLWPGCWAEAGVQLSFAALFGIAIGQDLAKSPSARFFIPCVFATSFTAIVSSAWFETLSVSSIVANFVLAPWFGVLGCYLGFSLVIACYLDLPFVDELAMLARLIIGVCLQIVEWAHSFMPEPLNLTALQCLTLLGALILFLVLYCRGKAGTWAKEFNILKSHTKSSYVP